MDRKLALLEEYARVSRQVEDLEREANEIKEALGVLQQKKFEIVEQLEIKSHVTTEVVAAGPVQTDPPHIRLEEDGYPARIMAFAQAFPPGTMFTAEDLVKAIPDARPASLFDAIRRLKLRGLIGSTAKRGEYVVMEVPK